MQSDFSNFFWPFLAGILVSALVLTIYFFSKIAKIRKTAIKQSKSVILWEVSEKILPMLPNFPYQSKDLVFLGKGVDYIVFDWLSEGNLRQIIFLEIKTWKSQLNKNEKMIQHYLASFPVKYEIIQVKY